MIVQGLENKNMSFYMLIYMQGNKPEYKGLKHFRILLSLSIVGYYFLFEIYNRYVYIFMVWRSGRRHICVLC